MLESWPLDQPHLHILSCKGCHHHLPLLHFLTLNYFEFFDCLCLWNLSAMYYMFWVDCSGNGLICISLDIGTQQAKQCTVEVMFGQCHIGVCSTSNTLCGFSVSQFCGLPVVTKANTNFHHNNWWPYLHVAHGTMQSDFQHTCHKSTRSLPISTFRCSTFQ